MASAAVWQPHSQLADNMKPDAQKQGLSSSSTSSHANKTSLAASLNGSDSSPPSSLRAVGREARNPQGDPFGIHANTIQEIHVIQVKGDGIVAESGTIKEISIPRAGHPLPELSDVPPVGPPPPSPPASVDRIEDDQSIPPTPMSAAAPRSPCTVSFEDPVRGRPRASPRRHNSDSAGPSTPNVLPDTRIFTSSSVPAGHQGPIYPSPTDITMPRSAHSHLHPPSTAFRSRHSRRNTTGSAPRSGSLHVKHGSYPLVFNEDGEIDRELATDIQFHAEQIRRERQERQSKRVKAQEVEAALMRPGREESRPLVGNVIGEGHVNYILMYNMLTGIRIGVSRCQAKIKRLLTDEDFTARHKYSFDIIGNELTPSAKYDFKFKDYAPWVFRELREDVFLLDPADYLVSLTEQYILSELGSPGKSGSFFYFSRDYRFIIKTIRHSEHKFLLRILKSYYAHVKANPHTLLSRFYGLHRVKLPRGRKIHFVIMNNLFPPHKDIHETYDLKGSTFGREYPEEKLAQNPRAVLKDLNWIKRHKQLELGPEKRALLTEQLRRDAQWLKTVNVMDYSLLVGIHNMQRGNRDNVRRNTLKVFKPDMPRHRWKPTHSKGIKSPEAMVVRRAVGSGQTDTSGLPEDARPRDRLHLLFYQDEGGLQATGEENEPLDKIYYLGIIDILTPYTVVKRLEHVWKGMQTDRHKISAVAPTEYANRFFSFIKNVMRQPQEDRLKAE